MLIRGDIDLFAAELVKRLFEGSIERTMVLIEQDGGSPKGSRVAEGGMGGGRDRTRMGCLQPVVGRDPFAILSGQHFNEPFDDSRSAVAMDLDDVVLGSPDDHFVVDFGSKLKPAVGKAVTGQFRYGTLGSGPEVRIDPVVGRRPLDAHRGHSAPAGRREENDAKGGGMHVVVWLSEPRLEL